MKGVELTAESLPLCAEELGLLRQCQGGDLHAFGQLVERHKERAYFVALGLVGNHDDALDLSQDAFVRAFRAISSFDPERRFFTWYYRILRNLCLNHLRRRSRQRALFEEATSEDPASSLADPSVLAERSELSEHLWRALAALRPEAREVFVLREIDGCGYDEIAERLEIPRGTVMSRLYYARQRLHQQMQRLS